MQKAVLKLDVHEEKDKEKAMKIVSGIAGVDSIDMNMEKNKLTVTGAIDVAELVMKLRKLVSTDIISVGPAEEARKDDNRSNKNEQSEASTFDPAKGKGLWNYGHYYNYCTGWEFPVARVPPPLYHYGRYVTGEEYDPNACVIC